jgi:nicotinamide mononucleotide (NMN) deamidase PncC
MVCIGVATEDGTVVRTFRFPGNRELVKTFSAFTALDMVRRVLLNVPPNVDWNERIQH